MIGPSSVNVIYATVNSLANQLDCFITVDLSTFFDCRESHTTESKCGYFRTDFPQFSVSHNLSTHRLSIRMIPLVSILMKSPLQILGDYQQSSCLEECLLLYDVRVLRILFRHAQRFYFVLQLSQHS